ncbi:MAG: hypothetical protein IKE46_00620 [Selenomonadaceae bacterium]|nr:hypothetical protein [Selenomonadaceae bacterium]
MNKHTLIEKLKAMAASPSASDPVKQAVKVYLAALAVEQVAVNNLIAVLEDNVVDVDELLLEVEHDFDHLVKHFGVEGAKIFAENARALKAAGAKYCNCMACTVALEILDNKDVLRG